VGSGEAMLTVARVRPQKRYLFLLLAFASNNIN